MEFRKLPREHADARALRYLNYPGVYYPEAVLRGPGIPGSTRSNPLREVPKGYVSTAVAAQMLEVSERSARALLSRHKVTRVMVREPGKGVRAYWDECELQGVMAERLPLVESMTDNFCNSYEACCLLSVARSTLSRYVKNGLLRESRVRMASESGVRVESYFVRTAVRRLAMRRELILRRLERLRRNRLTQMWESYQKRRGKKEGES